MRTFKNLFPLFLGLILISGCKKEDAEKDKTPPTAFELAYLADKEIDVVLNPKLIWESSTSSNGAVTYSLLIDRKQDLVDQGLSEPVTTLASGLEVNYLKLESYLNINTEYFWYVLASDADGNSTRSTSIYSFITADTVIKPLPPDSFKLLLPIDGFLDAPLKPSLLWEASNDPSNTGITYDVYMGLNPNPKGMVQQNIGATGITIPNELEYETTYYWWVEAKNKKGASTASTTFSFTTIPDIKKLKFKVLKASGNLLDSSSGRYGHQVVIKDDILYELGGNDQGTKNSVHISTNGVDWLILKRHDVDGRFFPSDEHQAVVFKNKIWVFDGTRNSIHNSSDGYAWENVTVSGSVIDGTHWKGKHGHQVIVYKGKMWVIGGTNAGIPTNDVWSSPDGIDWTKESAGSNSLFGPRIGHACAVYDGKMFVVGGSSGGLVNDVWCSEDGKNWELVVENADFDPRTEHTLTSVKDFYGVGGDILMLVGGRSGPDNADVWVSLFGAVWDKIDMPADYPARTEHQTVVHDNKVWIFQGKKSANGLNDAWTIEKF